MYRRADLGGAMNALELYCQLGWLRAQLSQDLERAVGSLQDRVWVDWLTDEERQLLEEGRTHD